jgi:hypothetical protein
LLNQKLWNRFFAEVSEFVDGISAMTWISVLSSPPYNIISSDISEQEDCGIYRGKARKQRSTT